MRILVAAVALCALPSLAAPADVSAETVTVAGSTNPRILADRFGDVVNVKDFGATPSAAAAAAAEAAAAAANGDAFRRALNTGKPVFVPPGVFKISGGLTLEKAQSQVLFGAGASVSVLEVDSASDDGINLRDCIGVSVRDLTVRAGGQSTAAGIVIRGGGSNALERVVVSGFAEGISIQASDPFLDIVRVEKTAKTGIHIQSTGTVATKDVVASTGSTWRRVHVAGNAGDGVVVEGRVTGFMTENLQIESCLGSGLVIKDTPDRQQPSEGWFSRLIVDSSGVDGVRVDAGTMQYFDSPWVSNRGKSAPGSSEPPHNFFLGSHATEVSIIGGRLYNFNRHGIEIAGNHISLIGTAVESVPPPPEEPDDPYTRTSCNGIVVEGTASAIDLIGVRATGIMRRGIAISEGASEYRVIGGQLGPGGLEDRAEDKASTLLYAGGRTDSLPSSPPPYQRLNGTLLISRKDVDPTVKFVDGAVGFADGKTFLYGAEEGAAGWLGLATNNSLRVIVDGQGLHPSRPDGTFQTGGALYVGEAAPVDGTGVEGSFYFQSASSSAPAQIWTKWGNAWHPMIVPAPAPDSGGGG